MSGSEAKQAEVYEACFRDDIQQIEIRLDDILTCFCDKTHFLEPLWWDMQSRVKNPVRDALDVEL